MERLVGTKLQDALATLPAWRADDGALQREYTFGDFKAAIQFVNNIATLAEAAGHHPDILIRYNKVKLSLETHDAGGITDRDFRLAKDIDQKLGQ